MVKVIFHPEGTADSMLASPNKPLNSSGGLVTLNIHPACFETNVSLEDNKGESLGPIELTVDEEIPCLVKRPRPDLNLVLLLHSGVNLIKAGDECKRPQVDPFFAHPRMPSFSLTPVIQPQGSIF